MLVPWGALISHALHIWCYILHDISIVYMCTSILIIEE